MCKVKKISFNKQLLNEVASIELLFTRLFMSCPEYSYNKFLDISLITLVNFETWPICHSDKNALLLFVYHRIFQVRKSSPLLQQFAA